MNLLNKSLSVDRTLLSLKLIKLIDFIIMVDFKEFDGYYEKNKIL